jgi:hypothetical protein
MTTPDPRLILSQLDVVCEFCETGYPRFEYPCADFDHNPPAVTGPRGTATGTCRYLGEWLACLRCHHLIEAQDLAGLFDRCWSIQVMNGNPMIRDGQDQVREHLVSLWSAFLAHRQGPAVLARLEGRRRGMTGTVELDP